MNHQKLYEAIIQKAKSENRIKLRKNQEGYIYYENHHILPACMSGCNESYNMQLLTDKEHYVCHKLLTYIYKGNRSLAWAFHKMTYGKNGNHIKSSIDYAYAKELMRLTPVSEETRQKISKNNKGKHSFKLSEEHKRKLSEFHKGLKHSMASKQKMGKKGENHPFYGKHHSEESKIEMKKSGKNRDNSNYRTEEHRKKQKEAVSGEKNGMFGISVYEHWINTVGEEKAKEKANDRYKKASKSLKGKHRTEEQKKNYEKGALKRIKTTCPYCNKTVDPGNYKRFHGDNCKHKNKL
jgi:hypothetical protein